MRVRNNGQAPLAVRYKGFSTPSSTNTDPLHAKLGDAARLAWAPSDDEGVAIILPGDVLTFAITNASEKGLLRAEVNGFSQHYDVLGAAAAFVAGFHSGNAAVAAEILDTNAPAARVDRLPAGRQGLRQRARRQGHPGHLRHGQAGRVRRAAHA